MTKILQVFCSERPASRTALAGHDVARICRLQLLIVPRSCVHLLIFFDILRCMNG